MVCCGGDGFISSACTFCNDSSICLQEESLFVCWRILYCALGHYTLAFSLCFATYNTILTFGNSRSYVVTAE